MHSITHQSYFANASGPVDVDALMAFHKTQYPGGIVMEEQEGEGEESSSESADQESEQSAEEGSTEEQSTEESTEENESEDEGTKLSREDAIAALKKTRKSEAGYRTRLRELEQKLEQAKTPEEVESLVNETKKASAEETRALLVENVALAHKLPPELADALKGATREELEAHAKVLAKFAPDDDGEPDNLRGGLDPSDTDDSFDPRAVARANRSRRR